ncbi:uncharacterized protein G2W53_041661 [Senna tora]|uniref:Uncharacterized protein n=1 Tax=Senna tora TaxID=362788 RepID=A0A834VZC8_9FABA|nr:uncharacterized protein G2W53_041661 [Senna tora]
MAWEEHGSCLNLFRMTKFGSHKPSRMAVGSQKP